MIFLTVTAVKMQKSLKYTIFRTKWGYFGLAGVENTLWRTCLPLSEPEKVKLELLKSRPVVALKSRIERDKNLFKTLQEQIIAYFEGVCINFSRDIPIELHGFSSFIRSVLTACRNIKFGQTIGYSALARKIGRPDAARAVGNALAKNPLPLIVPCHRVICSDGAIGGFSAPGGTNLKAKMLKHENSVLIDYKSI
jgi:methylated-DNA-[protein]-cysteine S-methyltransferase